MTTWIVLFVGIAASVAGAYVWKGSLEARRQEQFEPIATDVAEVIDTALARDDDLTQMARSLIQVDPEITNLEVSQWFANVDGNDRYPESLGFQYIERVTPADLPAFAAEVNRDQIPFSAGVHADAMGPPVFGGAYCLSRYQVIRADSTELTRAGAGAMTQVDWCATALAARLDAAARSGEPVELSMVELVHAIGGLVATALHIDPATVEQGTADFLANTSRSLFLFAPVYRGGITPATPELREQALTGWIGGIFDVGAILDAAIGSRDGYAVSITGANDSLRDFAMASANTDSVSGPLRHDIDIEHHGRWTVSVVGDLPSVSPSPATETLGILGVGALVTFLLFSLLRTLATARNRALALVDAKTGELRHQALHDPLTGLANRALVLDRTEQMLARSRRDGASVAMLFIDLDDFKDVNDTAGHIAGDTVLVEVAARIKALLQDTDTVGRLGGDEFVVVAESTDTGRDPRVLAQEILDALTEPFALGEQRSDYPLNASIGVAVDGGLDATELLRAADIALYEAKNAGKNRFVVFEGRMRDEVQERIELDLLLRQALEGEQFRLVYQPTFDLETMTTTGVEALVRWQHPERGLVPPADFLPLLEHNGLIVPVGRWILEAACRQAATWHAAGHPLVMAVNVSACQLDSGTLIGDVAEALERTGLDPKYLVIEITESVLMNDTTTTVDQLASLKRLGVRVAIDDFGTGYSSLAYLRRFPVDILKIDRSFVAGMVQSSDSAALVRTLIQLGKALGLETIAEGIEYVDQLQRLRAEGCDTGQGYLVSRPLPARDIPRFLARATTTAAARADHRELLVLSASSR